MILIGLSYNEFCDFVMKLNCTNDEAERNIKMLQDSLKDGQTLEDVLQNDLLVTSAHRKLVSSDKAGNRTKANLSQMGRIIQFNLNTLSSVNTRSLGRPFKIKVKFLSLQNYIKLKYKFELIGLRSLLALQ